MQLWLATAFPCPVCQYPNDEGSGYCQSCGSRTKPLCQTQVSFLNESAFSEREQYLENLISSSSYNKKKCTLEKELIQFLQVESLSAISPKDICRFLIKKDEKGKTQIHVVNCGFLGKTGIFECGCPTRLAVGTVQSMVGQLRTIFENDGKGKIYDELRETGNPAYSLKVQKYFKAIQQEQSLARTPVKQAKPIFFDKLRKITDLINLQLADKNNSLALKYILLRDQTFFKVQFFGGDRAGDLSRCVTQEIRRMSNNEGFIFFHHVGKTLSNGKTNVFSLMRMDDKNVCPVVGLENYVKKASLMGIDLTTGYLFRPVDHSKKLVLDTHVSTSLMHSRLKFYMKTLGIDEGESIHGIRGGCAVTMSVLGSGSPSDMEHVGWFSRGSLDRYSRMGKMTQSSVSGNMMKQVLDHPEGASNIFTAFGDMDSLNHAF